MASNSRQRSGASASSSSGSNRQRPSAPTSSRRPEGSSRSSAAPSRTPRSATPRPAAQRLAAAKKSASGTAKPRLTERRPARKADNADHGRGRRRPQSEAERFASNKKQDRLKKQRARTFRRSALIVGIIAVVALVGWGVWSFINSPIFDVKQVEVEGQRALAPGDVRTVVAGEVDTTLFRVSSRSVEEAVADLPWVASAEVKKRMPSTVRITVAERTPAATVTVPDGSIWLVSEDGYWLGVVGSSLSTTSTAETVIAAIEEGAEGTTIVDPAGKYPAVTFDPTALVGIFDTPSPKPAAGKKVSSAEVLNAISVLEGLGAELRGQVERVTAPEVGSTSLIIESGVELVIGSADDIMVKSKVILSILKAHEGSVSLINVRSVNNPTWRGLDSE